MNYLLCQKTSNYIGIPYYCENMVFTNQNKTDNQNNQKDDKTVIKVENDDNFIKKQEEIKLSLEKETNDKV